MPKAESREISAFLRTLTMTRASKETTRRRSLICLPDDYFKPEPPYRDFNNARKNVISFASTIFCQRKFNPFLATPSGVAFSIIRREDWRRRRLDKSGFMPFSSARSSARPHVKRVSFFLPFSPLRLE